MNIKMMTETGNLRFEWSGGAYIAIYSKKHEIEVNVINVWDYELDKPVIERSFDGFRNRVIEWLSEPEDTSDIR